MNVPCPEKVEDKAYWHLQQRPRSSLGYKRDLEAPRACDPRNVTS